MNTYIVWITLHSRAAKTAGIIGERQHTRSSWASGKLEYISINDGSQISFTFQARDDNQAYAEANRLYHERNPRDTRVLAGKSYIRHCRAALR